MRNLKMRHHGRTARERAQDDTAVSKRLQATLELLRTLAAGGSTLEELERVAQRSQAGVYRLIAECRDAFDMEIECHEGIYAVRDWGLVNKRRLVPRRPIR